MLPKGLEFHTVFITGLEEGLFPHQNSQREFGGLDEERRLMYVAITRARRRLYLSFAQSRMLHGQVSYAMPSSFLRELPDNLLHWITPKVAQRNAFAQSYTPQREMPVAALLQRSATTSDWRSGQAVFHTKFGEGMIVNLEGNGADARVQVNFRKCRGEVAGAGICEADGDLKLEPRNSPNKREFIGSSRLDWIK